MAAQRKGANSRSVSKSRSARAGLKFPVGRIHRQLRKRRTEKKRIAAGVPVFLAAVLEYLVTEILDIAGNITRESKVTRLTPRHIQMAIRNDLELNELLRGVIIAEGGAIPRVHGALMPKKKTKKISLSY